MMSSDATLHTIHMDGAATFNLPFPFTDHVTSRAMSTAGLVHLRCNGGHVWMNAEMMVVSASLLRRDRRERTLRVHRRPARNLPDRRLA